MIMTTDKRWGGEGMGEEINGGKERKCKDSKMSEVVGWVW